MKITSGIDYSATTESAGQLRALLVTEPRGRNIAAVLGRPYTLSGVVHTLGSVPDHAAVRIVPHQT
ncbi:hypothetical protein [Geminicoccus roseus]|uniref:hypothetical protein n=1 Tax=Geminicoccus roseus TaxID=404900 RepID=UPI0012F98704|nr:hypothetical protein [Geminicoccus roseus]